MSESEVWLRTCLRGMRCAAGVASGLWQSSKGRWSLGSCGGGGAEGVKEEEEEEEGERVGGGDFFFFFRSRNGLWSCRFLSHSRSLSTSRTPSR